MDMFEIIAERKIREAIDRGEFENLPGYGQPLIPDGLENLPEDLRVAYKILKNAGILPEEMESRKEIVSLQNLIQACHDDAERSELTRKLNEKELRLNMIMEKRKREIPEEYREKLMERMRKKTVSPECPVCDIALVRCCRITPPLSPAALSMPLAIWLLA